VRVRSGAGELDRLGRDHKERPLRFSDSAYGQIAVVRQAWRRGRAQFKPYDGI
jgi:hypothetical protein